MKHPRVLVVRSGARVFSAPGASPEIAIVEKVSHTVVAVAPAACALERPADYIVFTSATTVEQVFADDAVAAGLRRALGGVRVVAVGGATAASLRERGVTPAVVAGGSGEAVLASLPHQLEGRRVLLPCGEDASPRLADGLEARGASVTRLVVYRKVPGPVDAGLDVEILGRPFSAFCVTSPAAASWLFAGRSEPATLRLRETPAVVLGPSTRRYLESREVERICVTSEPRFQAAAALLAMVATLATPPAGK